MINVKTDMPNKELKQVLRKSFLVKNSKNFKLNVFIRISKCILKI